MAVIDDVEWRGLVFEVDRRQRRFLWAADVDGGLLMPIFAGCEVWLQLAPMARS